MEELLEGSISKIYRRIIFTANERKKNVKYSRVLCKMLPSYLCSFNYKVHNDLLPVNTKFRMYCLDNDSCCYFCSVGPESIFHIFGTCEKLEVLWKIATETVFNVTQFHCDFTLLRKNLMLDLVSVPFIINSFSTEKMLIYFNTVLNFAIWKERNEIKYNFKIFSLDSVVRRVIRSMTGRRNIDDRLLGNRKVPFIRDLCSIFQAVTKKYFPIDNG